MPISITWTRSSCQPRFIQLPQWTQFQCIPLSNTDDLINYICLIRSNLKSKSLSVLIYHSAASTPTPAFDKNTLAHTHTHRQKTPNIVHLPLQCRNSVIYRNFLFYTLQKCTHRRCFNPSLIEKYMASARLDLYFLCILLALGALKNVYRTNK